MFARRNPHTAGRRRDTGLFRTTRDLVATLVGIVVLLVALDRLGAVSIPFVEGVHARTSNFKFCCTGAMSLLCRLSSGAPDSFFKTTRFFAI